MQKLIVVLMLISVILIAGCSVESIENSNQEESHSDCPFGKVDCEYPGNCGRYIDINENNICDHSE